MANSKRKLAILKAKESDQEIKPNDNKNNKGFFKKILEIVTIDNNIFAKDGNKSELERNIKGLKLMQDEIYMSIFNVFRHFLYRFT